MARVKKSYAGDKIMPFAQRRHQNENLIDELYNQIMSLEKAAEINRAELESLSRISLAQNKSLSENMRLISIGQKLDKIFSELQHLKTAFAVLRGDSTIWSLNHTHQQKASIINTNPQ